MYDVTNKRSFDNAFSWITAVKERAQQSCVIILVGHKTDSPRRQVPRKDAEKAAEKMNILYGESSIHDYGSMKHVLNELMTSIWQVMLEVV